MNIEIKPWPKGSIYDNNNTMRGACCGNCKFATCDYNEGSVDKCSKGKHAYSIEEVCEFFKYKEDTS